MNICAFCNRKIIKPAAMQLGDRSWLCLNCANKIPAELKKTAQFYWDRQDYANLRTVISQAPLFQETLRYGIITLDAFHGLFREKKNFIYDMRYVTSAEFRFFPNKLQKPILKGEPQYAIGDLILNLKTNVPKAEQKLIIKSNIAEQILAEKALTGDYTIKDIKFGDKEQNFINEFLVAWKRANAVRVEPKTQRRENTEQQRTFSWQNTQNAQNARNDSSYQQEQKRQENAKEDHPRNNDLSKAMATFLLDSMDGVTLEKLKHQRNQLLKTFHTDNGEVDPGMAQKINDAYALLKQHIAC